MSELISRTRVRKFIMLKFERMRSEAKIKQIAGSVFEQLDAKLRAYIVDAVQRHPSGCHTFKDLYINVGGK